MRTVLLSDRQVDLIHDLLLNHGVRYDSLRMDLLDHLCCMVEDQMNRGVSFEKALDESVVEFGPEGLHKTHEATIYLLTLKFRKMKKIMSVTGILGGLLVCLGVFLKVMHFPGANISLVLGLPLISLVYLPLLLVVKLKGVESSTLKMIYTIGILAAIIFGMSVMFKFMHWPYADVLMFSTLVIMGAVFMPVYLTHSFKLTENKLSNLAFGAVLFAAIFGLYGLSSPRSSKVVDQSTYVMHQNLIDNLDRLSNERKAIMANTGKDLRGFNAATSELLHYIKEMRTEAVVLTQEVNPAKAERMNLEDMAWGENVPKLQQRFTAESSEYSATGLQNKIQAWKSAAVSAGVSKDRVDHWTPTDPVARDGSTELGWEDAYFRKATVLSLISYLDQLALEVNQRYIQAAG